MMLWECWSRTPTANKGDHSKSIPNALKNHIPVYSCLEVSEMYEGVKALSEKRKYMIGHFKVTPLSVVHNVENYSYLIEHEEIGKLAFCTDAVGFPYKIPMLSHILIEANYSSDLIIDHLCDNEDIRSHNEYHMEIEETIKAIRRNYSPDLVNVIICHLSDSQSDEEMFKRKIFDDLGVRVVVAEKGLNININKDIF